MNGPASDIERAVSDRARSFDLKPLLELLIRSGYLPDEIFYKSHHGGSSSFVESVTFESSPRRVWIEVNLGLLGDNSLLPSYYEREIARVDEPDRFYDFIGFFEHWLIKRHVAALWPEEDRGVFASYDGLRHAFLHMAGFASLSSMTWLAQLLFPEFEPLVRREAFQDAIRGQAVRLADAPGAVAAATPEAAVLDGSFVLGDVYRMDAHGFEVDLTVEDEVDPQGRSWAVILRKRIAEELEPLLAGERIALCVRLRVLTHASWLHLDPHQRARGEYPGFLGYDRFRSVPGEHRVVLWKGTTGAGNTHAPPREA